MTTFTQFSVSTVDRRNDTPPSDREQIGTVEKPELQFLSRGEVLGLYCCSADIELEIKLLLWNVHVEYTNGEIQEVGSPDDIPDPVLELRSSLAEFF